MATVGCYPLIGNKQNLTTTPIRISIQVIFFQVSHVNTDNPFNKRTKNNISTLNDCENTLPFRVTTELKSRSYMRFLKIIRWDK